MNQPPDVIYLQWDPEGDTTWCQDKINEEDEVYVRWDEVDNILRPKLHLNALDLLHKHFWEESKKIMGKEHRSLFSTIVNDIPDIRVAVINPAFESGIVIAEITLEVIGTIVAESDTVDSVIVSPLRERLNTILAVVEKYEEEHGNKKTSN